MKAQRIHIALAFSLALVAVSQCLVSCSKKPKRTAAGGHGADRGRAERGSNPADHHRRSRSVSPRPGGHHSQSGRAGEERFT